MELEKLFKSNKLITSFCRINYWWTYPVQPRRNHNSDHFLVYLLQLNYRFRKNLHYYFVTAFYKKRINYPPSLNNWTKSNRQPFHWLIDHKVQQSNSMLTSMKCVKPASVAVIILNWRRKPYQIWVFTLHASAYFP